MTKEQEFTLPLSKIDKHDIAIAGGKGANLGEMIAAHFPVPNGFVVTAHAYFHFLDESKLKPKIKALFTNLDKDDPHSLFSVSKAVQHLILTTHMPEEVAASITASYRILKKTDKAKSVAVRSSATAEDLPGASFAGQQDTYLNIEGEKELVVAVHKAWASLFTPRAIFYREEKKFDHFKIGIAIVVQKMVVSQVSGVMFSIDPVTNNKNGIVIEAVLGLGEMIVQGKVTPDHFEIDKHTLSITNKIIAQQSIALVKKGKTNKEIRVSSHSGKRQKLPDHLVLKLAALAKALEKHYYFPQDSEWAFDGKIMYIVQTRPVTTMQETGKHQAATANYASVLAKLPIIVKGAAASPGIACGAAVIIKSLKDIDKVKPGDVLLATMTNPDYVPAMRKACAIVTDLGGRTSHAAIVSRELGIPAVVGTETATKRIPIGTVVTVDGGSGTIYKGGLPASHQRVVSVQGKTETNAGILRTATKVYCNLAEPELATDIATRHVDGVGLFRAEFMMAAIGTHPKKLIEQGKQKIFVEKLVDGMLQMTKAFDPRPVVYRASDFKTNEYRNLKGGEAFEPKEENPMIGYRGAFRYIADPKTFALELEAIKIVRNKHGMRNLYLMIPFVRTVQELEKIKKIVSLHGLHRSNTFRLWMMAEIPANVFLLEDFIKAGIDGISIGSNDLTQLILGVDRDNAELAQEFDERNPAVLQALIHLVKTAKKYGITSSICGQAPSVYPEITEILVEAGITSVSVSPDTIEHTREIIAIAEHKLVNRGKGKEGKGKV